MQSNEDIGDGTPVLKVTEDRSKQALIQLAQKISTRLKKSEDTTHKPQSYLQLKELKQPPVGQKQYQNQSLRFKTKEQKFYTSKLKNFESMRTFIKGGEIMKQQAKIIRDLFNKYQQEAEKEKLFTDDDMLRELETERMFLRKFGHTVKTNQSNTEQNNNNSSSGIEFLEIVNNNTEYELMKKGANNHPFEHYLQKFIKKQDKGQQENYENDIDNQLQGMDKSMEQKILQNEQEWLKGLLSGQKLQRKQFLNEEWIQQTYENQSERALKLMRATCQKIYLEELKRKEAKKNFIKQCSSGELELMVEKELDELQTQLQNEALQVTRMVENQTELEKRSNQVLLEERDKKIGTMFLKKFYTDKDKKKLQERNSMKQMSKIKQDSVTLPPVGKQNNELFLTSSVRIPEKKPSSFSLNKKLADVTNQVDKEYQISRQFNKLQNKNVSNLISDLNRIKQNTTIHEQQLSKMQEFVHQQYSDKLNVIQQPLLSLKLTIDKNLALSKTDLQNKQALAGFQKKHCYLKL